MEAVAMARATGWTTRTFGCRVGCIAEAVRLGLRKSRAETAMVDLQGRRIVGDCLVGWGSVVWVGGSGRGKGQKDTCLDGRNVRRVGMFGRETCEADGRVNDVEVSGRG